MFSNGSTAMEGLSGGTRRGGASISHRENADRPSDILQPLFAGIVEGDVDLVSYISMSIIGQANAPGLRDRLEAYRDIDRVAENIAVIPDDVANIDADPEFDAIVRCKRCIAFAHATLHVDRASHRIHDAIELGQQPVAGIFNDRPEMSGDFRNKQPPKMLLQPYMRAFLVRAGQPAVPGNIGRQNGNEPPCEVLASQGWSSLP